MPPQVWLHRTLYELSAKLNIYENQLKKMMSKMNKRRKDLELINCDSKM